MPVERSALLTGNILKRSLHGDQLYAALRDLSAELARAAAAPH
jgi:hypothetical protein